MKNISIVIPIYGVEKYIEKCLMSCIRQDVEIGKDYEIICINDGTKDKSALIARCIASQYEGIRVIDQVNGGLSVARNTGLNHASGEYVWFVDSDDYIEMNCLKEVVDVCKKTNADIVSIQRKFVYEDGRTPELQPMTKILSVQKGVDVLVDGSYPPMAQLSIYRREFLLENNLRFYPGIYHEDSEFTPRALYFADRVVSYDKYVYNYLQRANGSITSNYKLKNGLDALLVCNNLYNFSQDLDERILHAFADRISRILFTHIYGLRYLSNEDKVAMITELKKNKHLFKFIQKGESLKSKVAGKILSINVELATVLFRIIYR